MSGGEESAGGILEGGVGSPHPSVEGVSSHSFSSSYHSNSNLKILYFNAWSLLPKFDELFLLADSHHPDVICITETWLSPAILDSEI